MKKTNVTRALTVALVTALSITLVSAFCGDNTPAYPVPECRDSHVGTEVSCNDPNAVRLWPDGFRPGMPGQRIPPERDSTSFATTTIPGEGSGHELFLSLNTAGGYLYVAYNAGIQVYDIRGNKAEAPRLLHQEDGWKGDFFSFPAIGENDFYIYDVAALPNPSNSNEILIAIAGARTAGPSFWVHNTATGSLTQFYQHVNGFTGLDARGVRMIEQNGRIYAFFVGPNPILGGGVFVYDVSAARTLERCHEKTNGGTDCPGVFKGAAGNIPPNAQYLDVMQKNGKTYMTTTPARSRYESIEIWDVNPASPGSAIRKATGLEVQGRKAGNSLFSYNGNSYLAILHQVAADATIKIFDVTNCLVNGCARLGVPVWTTRIYDPGVSSYLTFSESDGTPFLYYGTNSGGIGGEGTRTELLLDLSTLGTTNKISEITSSGRTYTDVCSGRQVDYWGDYKSKNGHGLSKIGRGGIVGAFNDRYFYRAAFSILDVHVRDGSGDQDPPEDTEIDPPDTLPPSSDKISRFLERLRAFLGGGCSRGSCSSEGQTQCVNSDHIRSCITGCWSQPTPCQNGLVCQNGQCTPESCNECALGETYCSSVISPPDPDHGAHLWACQTVNGCRQWTLVLCGTGQHCELTGSAHQCVS